jgi:hypothetical protein
MIATLQLTGHLTPYDYEAITVDNTVKTLTASKIEPNVSVAERDLGKAKLIRISVEGDQVRFREDGLADPTSSEGHLLNVGDYYYLANLKQSKNFKFTRVTANATLRVSYFR